MKDISESRKIINSLDKEIAKLFEARMRESLEIAEYKRAHGLPVYDEKREGEILASVSERIENKEIAEYYTRFVSHLMGLSKSYQTRHLEGMRVAYSGTEGAFAGIAAKKLFPNACAVAYGSFGEAYEAVVNGECDCAVLPLENSYNGEVGQVTDFMFSGPLFVNYITELEVSQNLLVIPGTVLSEIKTVISHPQALGQCAEFIKENSFQATEYGNTALAARLVSESGDRSLAAIASSEAAEIFGLEVLVKNINSQRNNTTRFAVFSPSKNKFSRGDFGVHSILLFTVRNEAGALAKAIEIIGKHGFNMRTIRSRPSKELLWQYYFYVETEGDLCTEEGEEMMRELAPYCDRLKCAGTYLSR